MPVFNTIETCRLYRLAFLRGVSLPFPLSSFDRSCSFASKILSAVPILEEKDWCQQHWLNEIQLKAAHGFLNSSGTSTEGFPSVLNFASNFGFSSC